MSSRSDRYTHGHHESVLRSHQWRTVENSAGFLVAHLEGGERLLDVGCGPGTISVDLARRLRDGHVTAIDLSSEVIELARRSLVDAPANLVFEVGDVYDLSYDDESFDIVLAHQVLQHLGDPVTALREMRRVVRPDGVVALRDADFAAFAWWPSDPRLDEWMSVYHEVARRNGAEPDAGRRLAMWVREAGFTSSVVSSSNWTFHTLEERQRWGRLWADRVRYSDFAIQALDYGVATPTDLEQMASAFVRWAGDDDGVFLVVNGEVLARR